MDFNFLAQSVIAMLVITAPPDPVKILFFNSIIEKQELPRTKAALQVTLVVLCILGGAALGGAQIGKLLGIDMNALSVVGGIVVAGMGFEMLYGGEPSKAQGKDNERSGPEEDSGLIMPLSIPLIAGPGAIVTTVSISTSGANPTQGMIAALIGAGGVALASFVAFQWLGGLFAKTSQNSTALLMRIGGLVLATIGTQMLLGGLKKFFAE